MIDFLCIIPTAEHTYDSRFEQEIYANFETQDTIGKLIAHLRKRVPDISVVNAAETGWQQKLSGAPVFNYTYGFGLLTDSARPCYYLETRSEAYFGARPDGIFLSANKPHASALMQALGYLVPKEMLLPEAVTEEAAKRASAYFADTDYLVVKPAYEESSIGLRLFKNTAEHIQAAVTAIREDLKAPLVMQAYIYGEDVTVPVIGRSEAITLPGLVLKREDQTGQPFIFDADSKATKSGLEYKSLENFDPRTRQTIYEMAKAAFNITHQRDYARLDLRVTPNGKCYFLEMNANPQLALGKASFSVSASKLGYEMCDIFEIIINGKSLDHFDILSKGL